MRHSFMWLLLLWCCACSSSEASSRGSGNADVTVPAMPEDLAQVRHARILFSHHSVGADLLAGMQRIDAKTGGGSLTVTDMDHAGNGARPVFIETSGGENRAPQSKIDAFVNVLKTLHAAEPQLALMKLCFVDFDPSTDVKSLFEHYRAALIGLKRENPGVTFAHITVPLRRRPDDLKSRLYRLIGRTAWEDAANAKRDAYNRQLLSAFAGDPIFDLARAESTYPDGSRETSGQAGQLHPSLAPIYTHDGGHLNDLGQQVIGGQLLHFLAGVLAQRGRAP